jgi:hypothetical protein
MMQTTLARLGPVTSMEFEGVGNAGWDSYRVLHEHGTSQWNILLDSQGTISGALLQALP